MSTLTVGLLVGLVAALGVAAHLWLDRRRLAAALERLRADLAAKDAAAALLQRDAASLAARVEEQAKAHDLYRQEAAQIERRSREAFDALAAAALKSAGEQLLTLAGQRLQTANAEGQAALDARRKAVEDLVKPIRESLEKQEKRLETLNQSTNTNAAVLAARTADVALQAAAVQQEAARLVQSLKAPQVRGRWGELTLRRVAELAGMSPHCDFDEQVQTDAAPGERLRPDMLVRLPGGRVIVVDAKCPLHAYIESIEATDETRRAERLKAHARQLRDRVDELAAKNYQAQFEGSPDFTALFVPGDQFLASALREQPDLIEHAAARNVVITTPATLIALLRAVSLGWQQASLAEDARAVLDLGRELHERVAKMTEHLARMGKALQNAVTAHNALVGNVESRVLPAARRLEDHHARSGGALADPAPITEAPRLPAGDVAVAVLPTDHDGDPPRALLER